jgi:hypothetical protein
MPPKKKITADAPEGETLTRIAIVNQDRSVVMCMPNNGAQFPAY